MKEFLSHLVIMILLVLVQLQGFSYPEGVAYKTGGPGSFQYALLEIHYDNPNLAQGILRKNIIANHIMSGMVMHIFRYY